MLTRSRPHEVPTRGVRPPDEAPPPPAPARAVHRLRRIRPVSAQAVTEIDQARINRVLRHRAS